MVELDPRVAAHYSREKSPEEDRLFTAGFGELTRLRTWDLFDRLLPEPPARVIDVGGGTGVHSERLASRGYDVLLLDPVERHVEDARTRSDSYEAQLGDARALPVADDSADVVLLMGPLYHLHDPADRHAALGEARRVLRPGGLLLAEVVSRFAWIMECAHEDRLRDEGLWRDFEANITEGLSAPPDRLSDGGFYAYFHRPEDAMAEVTASGFTRVQAYAVEGFVKHIHDLASRMRDEPQRILAAARMTEQEPSLLGASPHVLLVGKA